MWGKGGVKGRRLGCRKILDCAASGCPVLSASALLLLKHLRGGGLRSASGRWGLPARSQRLPGALTRAAWLPPSHSGHSAFKMEWSRPSLSFRSPTMPVSRSTLWLGAIVLGLLPTAGGLLMRSQHVSKWKAIEASSPGRMSPDAWDQVHSDADGFARFGAMAGGALFLLASGLLLASGDSRED